MRLLSVPLSVPRLCVQLRGVSPDPREFCLLCEFCDGGTLQQVLKEEQSYGDSRAEDGIEALETALDRMHQAVSGMAHVHARGFMHRE